LRELAHAQSSQHHEFGHSLAPIAHTVRCINEP
jgi:hypothetical protein